MESTTTTSVDDNAAVLKNSESPSKLPSSEALVENLCLYLGAEQQLSRERVAAVEQVVRAITGRYTTMRRACDTIKPFVAKCLNQRKDFAGAQSQIKTLDDELLLLEDLANQLDLYTAEIETLFEKYGHR